MKNFLRKVRNAASLVYADAGARLTVFLTTEPVRARAYVVSALTAASTVVPGFVSGRVDEILAGAIVSATAVVAGESARAKVSPSDEK